MIRRDFFELVEYAIDTRGRREVLHQRRVHRREPRPSGWRRWTTSTSRSASTAPTPAPTTRCAATARTPRPGGRWTTCADAGFGPFKISVVVTRHNVDQLDEFKALADSYGAQLRVTRLRPSGRGADIVARAAPDQRPAARDLPVAAGPRRRRADGRLVLPPQRARRAAARAQHVRRRPGGVPHRPDRRRVRLPVRDPRRVHGRHGARPGGFARVWRQSRAVPRAARAAQRPVRAPRAAATTPARAVAWRPSSSPACRSTVPTPSACSGHGELAVVGASSPPRPAMDHPQHREPVRLLRR